MKKLSVILLSGVALALAGCGDQGGSSDPYNTDSGTTSNTNYNRRSGTDDYQGRAYQRSATNDYQGSATRRSATNDYQGSANRRSATNDYQGSAQSPGGLDSGVSRSTNYPGWGTNNQSLTTDPSRTNTVPEN